MFLLKSDAIKRRDSVLMIFKSTIDIIFVAARLLSRLTTNLGIYAACKTPRPKAVALCPIEGMKVMDSDHSVIYPNGLN